MSAYFLNKSIVYGQTLEFLELIYDWVFSNFYALRRLPRSETIKEFNDVLKLMETRGGWEWSVVIHAISLGACALIWLYIGHVGYGIYVGNASSASPKLPSIEEFYGVDEATGVLATALCNRVLKDNPLISVKMLNFLLENLIRDLKENPLPGNEVLSQHIEAYLRNYP
jgi:hypothetical protein